jgi:protein O-GlcNAc transferase
MATTNPQLSEAIAAHQAGRLPEAEKLYRQVLATEPRNVEAWHLLGVMASQLGRHDVAVHCIGFALQLNPQFAEGYFSLGNAYRDLGMLADACRCLECAVALRPDYAEAHVNLGVVFHRQGNELRALACFREAVKCGPRMAAAHIGLGACLEELGHIDEAVDTLTRATELNQEQVEAFNNLGNALKDQGRLPEAIAAYRHALEMKPDYAVAHSNLCYTMYFCPVYDANDILSEHQRWNARHATPYFTLAATHDNDRCSDRPLRIGYVSPHFNEHVLAHFLVPLFASHDKRNYEITCYSDCSWQDAITKREQAEVSGWREVAGLSDEQLAETIRKDRIDICVDLAMHMQGSRLLMFARKPAPLQISWLAYPGTTGLTTIDYRLTDPYLDPPGEHDQDYSEKSFRLADTFWCYDALMPDMEVNSLPALQRGRVTFGCLSNFCKVNEGVLVLWAQVLHRVSNSGMLLMAPEGRARQWVRDVFQHQGVDSERIEFVSRQPRAEYIKLYHRVDIMLDTLPYNGHTTSLDAFWMGIPVVTVMGKTVVGRAGASQLRNLELTELVAHSTDQFVEIAAQLATDLKRLKSMRSELRRRMQQSPLMDASRFARSIEAAYRSAWRQWCQGNT